MKTNDDGQGVVPGVETELEERNRKYEHEKRIFANVFSDTNKSLSAIIRDVRKLETYKSNNTLELLRAVLLAIRDIERHSARTGSIRVLLRPQFSKCKVETSYNVALYENEEQIGKSIIKKAFFGPNDAIEPRDCADFDELQLN